MDKHSHIIRQQIFEVNFSSRDKSHELQNRISRLFYNHLTDRMEQLFERVIPDNKFLRVDNLTIDVGTIPYDWLDDEFSNTIIERIEQELLLILLYDQSDEHAEPSDTYRSEAGTYLGLLSHFLLTGTLPWWAAGEKLVTPVHALEYLIANSSGQLKMLIVNAGQRSYVRFRLVHQFPEQLIRAVIRILEPEQAEFIIEYHTDVVQLQQERQLVKSEGSAFNKAVWIFILTYLLVDRGTYFNRKDFVRSTLAQMSAHFNVKFSDLLMLFAAALKADSYYMKIADSLQAIIFELSSEESVNDLNSLQDEQSVDALESRAVSSDIELLQYYLVFGSFPWWSPFSQKEQLIELLISMITRLPQTTASMIREIGKQEQVRIRVVKVFDETVLQKIVKLIEPEQAEFIFDYVAEVRTIHAKNALVKTGSSELINAVWEFILEYLLVDRGSEFNRQMFLDSNIRRLANRFNIKYHDLLIFMVQSIGQVHQSSAAHVSLFQVLTGLYNGLSNNAVAQGTDLQEREQVNTEPGIVQRVLIKDILYFWMRFGHLPWWAGEHAGNSPAGLMERLLQESPEDAVRLLKLAGLKLFMRRRVIYQIPPALLLRLFGLFPQGGGAARYFELLTDMLRHNRLFKFGDEKIARAMLLMALWNNLIENEYEAFDPAAFIRAVVFDLSVWSGIDAGTIRNSLELQIASVQTSVPLRVIKEALTEGENTSITEELTVSVRIPDWTEDQNIEQFIAAYIAPGSSAADIAGEGLTILEYFLRYNKLPERFNIHAARFVNHFIKQLLLFLHKERLSGLEQILNSEKYPADRMMRIHEIFGISRTIEESAVSSLLKARMHKDILLYMQQTGLTEQLSGNLMALLDTYFNTPGFAHSVEQVRLLLQYATVAELLARSYTTETIYALIESLGKQSGWEDQIIQFLRVFNSWLLEILSGQPDSEHMDFLFRVFNLLMIGRSIQIGSVNDYLRYFFKFIYERQRGLVLKIAGSFLQNISSSKRNAGPVVAEFLPEIGNILHTYTERERRDGDITKLVSDSDKLALRKQLGDAFDEQQARQRKLLQEELEEKSRDEELKKEDHEDEDSIYINNAGLVLLHPLLNTYFNRLQMLENGDFISVETRYRAVHLLQYLVYGTEVNEEHELVLNKILCNIPVDEPVPLEITLTEHEKTVSEELLNAVLVQWDKLKNTSAESLKVSFLQRQGSLVRNEDGWTLRVEQRGYDVLLQTLPWGLGMIKAPWMTDIIYVEWM